MRLPPKNPGFPHCAILHAIVSPPVLTDYRPSLTFYGSVPRRLAGSLRT